MKIILEFEITPMPIQSVRSTRRGHFYQPQKNIDYKTVIACQAKSQLPNGFKIFTNAVMITKLVFGFPVLKSMPKKIKDNIYKDPPFFKETKPDLDNLFKGFADALNGIVWQDDALIVRIEQMYKIYTSITPYIYLVVENIPKGCRSY